MLPAALKERMSTTDDLPTREAANEDNAWIQAVRSMVSSLRFGVVQIVVHDASVVQIERTEKIRFDKPHAH